MSQKTVYVQKGKDADLRNVTISGTLTVDGNITEGVPVLPDGTKTEPGLAFTDDPDNGLYRIGSNNPAMSAGDTKVQDWTTTGTTITGTLAVTGAASVTGVAAVAGQISAAAGTKTAPGVAFTGDLDNGLYLAAANTPAMSAGDTKVQEWAATGSTVTGTLAVTGIINSAASTTVAAAGTTAANGGALPEGGFVTVSAANATKGVTLPVAAAGKTLRIKNLDAAVLKLWPATGDAINALTADAYMAIPASTCFTITAFDGTTWYTTPLVPS